MNTKPPVEIILEGIETLRKKRKDEFGNVIHYYNPIEVKQFIKSKEDKLKKVIIEAYQEGFHDELPFIDMEKWYNDKFESKFEWDKPEEKQERYPMTKDQTAQIDCRLGLCRFNNGGGNCKNISPAITLNEGKVQCWSKDETEGLIKK